MKFGRVEKGFIKMQYDTSELEALVRVANELDPVISMTVSRAIIAPTPISMGRRMAGRITDILIREQAITETKLDESLRPFKQ